MKLISVITVCLNVEEEIKDTIQSVLEQDFDNFEYLIQDGMSSDRTLTVVESYAPAFSEKGIPFRIITKKDQGIYDAMNKAVKEAQGEWLIYMNAGDCFADGKVLSRVGRNETLETADIVYGDEILRNNDMYMYKKARPLEAMRFGMPFRHQSAFTRKALLDVTPYSIKYRMGSDYFFYLQMYYEGKKFAYLPMVISIFDVNGISSDIRALIQERLEIYEEMPVRDEEAIQRLKNWLEQDAKKTSMHDHLWKFVPPIFRQMRRRFLRKKSKSGWKTEKEFFAEMNQKKENDL
ncbi:MAG: glycosyltransferase family 2 protein [Lachnospiraceae bacterium]